MSENTVKQFPSETTNCDDSPKVLIKSKKKRQHFRKRRDSNDEEDAKATL